MSDRHTNLLIFQLLKLLNSNRDKAFSYDEVKNCLNLDEKEFQILLHNVENNARIELHAGAFRFRPLFKFSSMEELESGLKSRFPDGIKYQEIQNDVSFLDPQKVTPFVSNIVVLEVRNNCHMLFYNDNQVPKVDKDLKDLWSSVIIADKHNQVFNS